MDFGINRGGEPKGGEEPGGSISHQNKTTR